MTTTVTRSGAPNAGFVRGIAALNPNPLAAHADDLRFLADAVLDEIPASATAAALARGIELLIREIYADAGLPAPTDIPTISPELMSA